MKDCASESTTNRPVRPDDIVLATTRLYGVDVADLAGKSRHLRVIAAREVCVYVIRQETTMSYHQMKRLLGRRSHSTLVCICTRVKKRLAARPDRCHYVNGGPVDFYEAIEVVTMAARVAAGVVHTSTMAKIPA